MAFGDYTESMYFGNTFAQPSGSNESSSLNNYLSGQVADTDVDQPAAPPAGGFGQYMLGNSRFGGIDAPRMEPTAPPAGTTATGPGGAGLVIPVIPGLDTTTATSSRPNLQGNLNVSLGGFGGAGMGGGMFNIPSSFEYNYSIDPDYFDSLSAEDQEGLTNFLGRDDITMSELYTNPLLLAGGDAGALATNLATGGAIGYTPTGDDETVVTSGAAGGAFANAADTGYYGKGSDATDSSLYNPAQGVTDGSIYDAMADTEGLSVTEGLDLTGGEGVDVTTGVGNQDLTTTTAGTSDATNDGTTTTVDGGTVDVNSEEVVNENNAVVAAFQDYQAGNMPFQDLVAFVRAADPSLVTQEVAQTINDKIAANRNFAINTFNQDYTDFASDEDLARLAAAFEMGINPYDSADELGVEDFYDDPTTEVNENIFDRASGELDLLALYDRYQKIKGMGQGNYLTSYTDEDGNLVQLDPSYDIAGLTDFDMQSLMDRRQNYLSLFNNLKNQRDAFEAYNTGLFTDLGAEADLQTRNLDLLTYADQENIAKTQNNLTNAIAIIDGILDGTLSDQNANVAVFRQQYSDEELNALRGSLQTQLNRITMQDDPETEADEAGLLQQFGRETDRLDALRQNYYDQALTAFNQRFGITDYDEQGNPIYADTGPLDFGDMDTVNQLLGQLEVARMRMEGATSPLLAEGRNYFENDPQGQQKFIDDIVGHLQAMQQRFGVVKGQVDSSVAQLESQARDLIQAAQQGDYRSQQALDNIARQMSALGTAQGRIGIEGYSGDQTNLNALLGDETGVGSILAGLRSRRTNELKEILGDFLPDETIGEGDDLVQSFADALAGTELYDEESIRGFGQRLLDLQDRAGEFTGQDAELTEIRDKIKSRSKDVKAKLDALKKYRSDLEKDTARKIREFRNKQFYNLSDLDTYEDELMAKREEIELYDAQQAFDEIDQLIALLEGRRGEMRGVYAQGNPGFTTNMPTGFGGRGYNPFMSKEEADRAYMLSQGYMPTALSQGGQYAADPYALPTVRLGS